MMRIMRFLKYNVEICIWNFYNVFKYESHGAIKSINVRVGVSTNN